jgi:hypothetical protein
MQNVTIPIEKAKTEIDKWKARNLSTQGRIIIVKTFGLSQVIYQMQNTFFDKQSLKEIEKITYKFIWNGPDKIKRTVMREDYNKGGLKCPDIEALDNTLKLKQLSRAA